MAVVYQPCIGVFLKLCSLISPLRTFLFRNIHVSFFEPIPYLADITAAEFWEHLSNKYENSP